MAAENKINQLVRSLLQKDSIEQCSLQELEQFASRHPYFGAAQLLLAKKMQEENNEGFREQLQKTFLFFHNPLWVQKLLGINGTATLEPNPQFRKVEKSPVVQEEEIITIPEPALPADEDDDRKGMDAPGDDLQSENLDGQPGQEPPASKEPAEEEIMEQPANNNAGNIDGENGGAGTEEEVFEREGENGEVQEKLQIAIPQPVDIQSDTLTFEPYHTVDYFASQGIRYKPEDRPDDKFGRQLKSFTDWLKIMKRLPSTEMAKAPQSGSEKKVEEMAQHSLEDRDVVTEAMAEVWIKQGNPEKARAIYRKLSLSEPSKSAYFAAKIDELK